MLKLATSRGLVILITFASAPLLGRLFPPHAYGALGVLSTILSILAAFASLSYVSAIPLASSPAESRNLFVVCSLIGILTTAIVTIGIIQGADLLSVSFHEPDVARYALFLPFMFIAQAVRQLFDITLSCQRRFGAVAVRNVLEVCVTRLVQVGSYFSSLIGSPVALIIGALCGSMVSAMASGLTSIRDIFSKVKEPIDVSGLRAVAIKYKKFPMFTVWSQTINALTFGLPALILGTRFSVEVVGLYGMAFSMVGLPGQLFVSSASQVFYVEAGDKVARGQSASAAAQHLIRILALLTAFPMAVVLMVGPLIFEVFLGAKWREAGVFAQILVPWVGLMAFSSPLAVVFSVFNRQGEGFAWNIALLTARFSALYFGGMLFGVRVTLGLFVAVSVVIVTLLYWRALLLFRVRGRWAAKTMARAYAESMLLLLPSGISYWWLDAKASALLALAAAATVYYLILYKRHPEAIRPLLASLPVLGAKWKHSESPAHDK